MHIVQNYPGTVGTGRAIEVRAQYPYKSFRKAR